MKRKVKGAGLVNKKGKASKKVRPSPTPEPEDAPTPLQVVKEVPEEVVKEVPCHQSKNVPPGESVCTLSSSDTMVQSPTPSEEEEAYETFNAGSYEEECDDADDADDEVASKVKCKGKSAVKSKGKSTVKSKGKSNVKSKRFNPRVYTDNSLTVGGKMKEAGTVLSSLKEQKKRINLNMQCMVETLGRLLAGFSDRKKQIVNEMGFSSLFFTAGKGLPRMLAYWLCTRVDVSKRKLITVDGKEFPLHPIQVNWVLGVPIGSRSVPVGVVVDKEGESRLFEMFKTTTRCGTQGIYRDTLVKWLEEDECADPSLWRKVFIMGVMSFLCSSTSHRLPKKFLSAAMVADEAKHYNWCAVVLDELLNSLRCFGKQFYDGDLPGGCGGCTIFLVILYLDRLDRLPVSWGERPRIKVWTTKLMNAAIREDRTDSGDFGQLGCLQISYGNEHPLEACDDVLFPRRRGKKSKADVREALLSCLDYAFINAESDGEGEGNGGEIGISQSELQSVTQNVKARRKRTCPNPFTSKSAGKQSGKSVSTGEASYSRQPVKRMVTRSRNLAGKTTSMGAETNVDINEGQPKENIDLNEMGSGVGKRSASTGEASQSRQPVKRMTRRSTRGKPISSTSQHEKSINLNELGSGEVGPS